MRLKATSFATRQDLAAFAAAVTRGSTPQRALSVGDNGVGAWGDATWKPTAVPPIVALPRKLGGRGRRVKVTLGWRTVVCTCLDVSPPGVIDLAPSALLAFGFDPDLELLDEAEVELMDTPE